MIYSTMAFRYWFLVHTENPEYTYPMSLQVHFLTPILARVTPANAGELIKLSQNKLDIKNASFMHLLERLVDFTIILVVSFGLLFILKVVHELYLYWRIVLLIGVILLVVSLGFLSTFNFNSLLNLFSINIKVERY